MVDSVPEQLQRTWRSDERLFDDLAEQQPEVRPGGSELCDRRKREVELQAAGKQEDAVNGAAGREVKERYGIELFGETVCPVVKHLADRYIVYDSKREVEIRPAVSRQPRQGTDDCPGDDTRVRLGPFENSPVNSIAILRSKHMAAMNLVACAAWVQIVLPEAIP